jgi:hypothetical protein
MVFRILLSFFVVFSAFGAEVAGIKLPDEEQKLVLNGAGLRKRAFFQVYVVGLYLPERKTAAADVIGAQGPKHVAIHMLREVDSMQFVDALKEGLKDNLSEAEMKAFEPQIAQLSAGMIPLKAAIPGMVFALDWVPGTGTLLRMNGRDLAPPIAGEDFYRALLKIWLGEKPVQADLKRALLGGRQ